MKTIVISDIHLGIDDAIAENVKNRPLLIAFLNRIREQRLADEVVINGDFLDQWFLPGSYHHVVDSDAFYRQCAENNRSVLDAFQRLVESGIPVIYVPGNHDMTLSYETLADLIPGIRQMRDVRGLGRYRTGTRGEVVIEHCHRYEFLCAPDSISNQDFMKYGQPILPPGYLFALVGVQSIVEGAPKPEKSVWDIPAPDPSDRDQMIAYSYYRFWKDILDKMFPVRESFDDPFIEIGVDGFQGRFSLNDVIPQLTNEGITAKLYPHMQRNWDELLRRNLAAAQVDLLEQLQRLTDQTLRAEYAKAQYFDLDPTVDVVVFGHTHVPYYQEFTEGYDRKKIYVNEATWIDNNMDDPENTAVFAEIDSRHDGTTVALRKCVASGDGEDFEICPVHGQFVHEC